MSTRRQKGLKAIAVFVAFALVQISLQLSFAAPGPASVAFLVPQGLLAKITATVENTMRAGKLPVQAITGTMSLMDSATKVMKGLAAAGQAVVEEAVKAAENRSEPAVAESDTTQQPEIRTLSP